MEKKEIGIKLNLNQRELVNLATSALLHDIGKLCINKELLDKLREIESGKWTKVYKDGYDSSGNKISIHYFQSESGKVFNVKVKPGWSN